MRQTLSPGWQTHLMFAEFDGVLTEHADHIVVHSARSPGYCWGDFLLYNRLPSAADRDDLAIGIYRQLGFQQHDTLWMLERRAPEDQASV